MHECVSYRERERDREREKERERESKGEGERQRERESVRSGENGIEREESKLTASLIEHD